MRVWKLIIFGIILLVPLTVLRSEGLFLSHCHSCWPLHFGHLIGFQNHCCILRAIRRFLILKGLLKVGAVVIGGPIVGVAFKIGAIAAAPPLALGAIFISNLLSFKILRHGGFFKNNPFKNPLKKYLNRKPYYSKYGWKHGSSYSYGWPSTTKYSSSISYSGPSYSTGSSGWSSGIPSYTSSSSHYAPSYQSSGWTSRSGDAESSQSEPIGSSFTPDPFHGVEFQPFQSLNFEPLEFLQKIIQEDQEKVIQKREINSGSSKNSEEEQEELKDFLKTIRAESEMFFGLLDKFDEGGCLQKLICQVHANNTNNISAEYTANMISTFNVLDLAYGKASEKYRMAAKLGRLSSEYGGELCVQSYGQCKYSAREIIDLGEKTEKEIEGDSEYIEYKAKMERETAEIEREMASETKE